jgi:hypothetical protein
VARVRLQCCNAPRDNTQRGVTQNAGCTPLGNAATQCSHSQAQYLPFYACSLREQVDYSALHCSARVNFADPAFIADLVHKADPKVTLTVNSVRKFFADNKGNDVVRSSATRRVVTRLVHS